jgi:hypothetical protein
MTIDCVRNAVAERGVAHVLVDESRRTCSVDTAFLGTEADPAVSVHAVGIPFLELFDALGGRTARTGSRVAVRRNSQAHQACSAISSSFVDVSETTWIAEAGGFDIYAPTVFAYKVVRARSAFPATDRIGTALQVTAVHVDADPVNAALNHHAVRVVDAPGRLAPAADGIARVADRAVVRAGSVAAVGSAAPAGAVGNAFDLPAPEVGPVAPEAFGTIHIALALSISFTLAGAMVAHVASGAIVLTFTSASVAPAALAPAIWSAFVPAVEVDGGVVNTALENEESKAYR